MAAEASATGGQDEAVAWVKEKLKMLAQHKPVAVPTFPTVLAYLSGPSVSPSVSPSVCLSILYHSMLVHSGCTPLDVGIAASCHTDGMRPGHSPTDATAARPVPRSETPAGALPAPARLLRLGRGRGFSRLASAW